MPRPHPSSSPCAISETTGFLSTLAYLTLATLHSLRQELSLCQDCDRNPSCRLLQEFNTAFNTALQEVIDEWNLAPLPEASAFNPGDGDEPELPSTAWLGTNFS